MNDDKSNKHGTYPTSQGSKAANRHQRRAMVKQQELHYRKSLKTLQSQLVKGKLENIEKLADSIDSFINPTIHPPVDDRVILDTPGSIQFDNELNSTL